jgi:hypothetical protein
MAAKKITVPERTTGGPPVNLRSTKAELHRAGLLPVFFLGMSRYHECEFRLSKIPNLCGDKSPSSGTVRAIFFRAMS